MGIKIQNVTKHFGEKLAVDNISFEMKKPGVFGLLGTNGAGKTTTFWLFARRKRNISKNES